MRRLTWPLLLVLGLVPACRNDPSGTNRHFISGKVSIGDTGQPGAVVRIEGTTTTVVTGPDGEYCIEAPAHTEVRVIASYVPAEVTAVTYHGSASVRTDAIRSCGAAEPVDIALSAQPI
jgi:hypothetical protein